MPNQRHLLIVTEENDLGVLLSRLVMKRGFIPHHVSDVTKAISIIQRLSFPITLFDFDHVSEKNFESLSTLKAANSTSSLVVLTQVSSPRTREKVLRAGADYCLIKPMDTKVIYECIDTVLSQKLFQNAAGSQIPEDSLRDSYGSTKPKPFIERDPRIPCRILVKYRPVSVWGDDQSYQGKEAVTRNVSAGGMELETDLLDDDIRKLSLQVYLSFDKKEWINSFGRIIWKRQEAGLESNRVGLQFLGLDECGKSKLLNYAAYVQSN